MSHGYQAALVEIAKLFKSLEGFNLLLKAKISTSLEDIAAPRAESEVPVSARPAPMPASESKLIPVRSMSSEAAAAMAAHPGDEHMQKYGKAFNILRDRLSRGHPDHTPKDLVHLENAILARQSDLQPKSAPMASSPSDRPSSQKYVVKEDEPGVKRAYPNVTNKRPVPELSPMQRRAQQAEAEQIADYTGEKHYVPKKGLSFQLMQSPIYQTEGENKETPSTTKHFIHYDGQPIGSATVDHYRRRMKIGGGDDAKQYAKVSLHHERKRENEVMSALHSHLKSDEYRNQLKQYKKPLQELEAKANAAPQAKYAEMLTPEEIRQEYIERKAEETKRPRTANTALKAPLREFSREKALSSKDTSLVAPKKAKEQPRQKSERTRELAREAYGKKSSESKPAESKPSETKSKPAESKPSETKSKPAESKPSEAKSKQEELLSMAHHADPEIRNHVINALLTHSNPEHTKILLDHDDPDVRRKAFDRLEEVRAQKSKSA